MLDWANRLPAGPGQLAALFVATVAARNMMEAAATAGIFHFSAFVFHFPIAYVFPMLTLTWLLHRLSGYPAGRLLKVMVFTWTLTLLPPVLDLLLGTSTAIGYFPLQQDNAAHFMLNFFNPFVELTGTTAGIRIEAAIGCLLAGVFVGTISTRRRLLRGVATTVLFAPVFLAFFTWPHLVQILSAGLFFDAGQAQSYFQLRVSTEPVLFGGAHITVFLVDLLPALVFGLLLLKSISRRLYERTLRALSAEPQAWIACLAGALAGLLAAFGSVLSFADVWALIGALAAAGLTAASTRADGGIGAALLGIGLLAAAAAGWSTLVVVGLAAALLNLPGPPALRRALGYPALFLAAAAPVLDPVKSGPLPLLALAAVPAALPRSRIRASLLCIPVIAAALLFGPSHPTSPAEGRHRENRYFAHGGRTAHAHLGSMAMAAADDELMRFAESAHLLGMTPRARWGYRVATARGDSASELLRVGVNLDMRSMEPGELQTRMEILREASHRDEGESMLTAALANAVARRDTAMLASMMEEIGPSPRLHTAYSRAILALGDTARAWRYARLAASHPMAREGQLSWAVSSAAMAGADYDSVYNMAAERSGAGVRLMSARLGAPMLAGDPPDMPELLRVCLEIRPASAGVLELAARWHSEAEDHQQALLMAERGIAAGLKPSRGLFELACRAAAETGEYLRLEAAADYGLKRFPGDAPLQCYLAAAQSALGRREEARGTLSAVSVRPDMPESVDSLCALASER